MLYLVVAFSTLLISCRLDFEPGLESERSTIGEVSVSSHSSSNVGSDVHIFNESQHDFSHSNIGNDEDKAKEKSDSDLFSDNASSSFSGSNQMSENKSVQNSKEHLSQSGLAFDEDLKESRTYRFKYGVDQYSMNQVLDWVEKDKRNGSGSKKTIYTYIPEKFLQNQKSANYARIALSKAINSVAIDADDIVHPEEISDGNGIVFALRLEEYWGSGAEEKMRIVSSASEDPKNFLSPAPRLFLEAFSPEKPVASDRLVYNLLHGGIYNQLIDTPDYGSELEQNLGMGKRTATLALKNGITFGVRYAERKTFKLKLKNQTVKNGVYWITYDEFFPKGSRDLPWAAGLIPTFRTSPVTNRSDGQLDDFSLLAAEAYRTMKNGLFAYYIWGNGDQERNQAEQSFVLDPLNHATGDLLTGQCAFCHTAGVQAAASDMTGIVRNGNFRDEVRQFWSTDAELASFYEADRKSFREAMSKIVDISDGDKEFNQLISMGTDDIEPMFYLLQFLTGNERKGNTAGLRRRNNKGEIPGLIDKGIKASFNQKLRYESSEDTSERSSSDIFEKQVLRIFNENGCLSCHQNYQKESYFDQINFNRLVESVEGEFPRMPPGAAKDRKTLGPFELKLLNDWGKQLGYSF